MTRQRVIAAVVSIAGAAAFAAWWTYPMHRIERELRALRMPDGVTQTSADHQDNGWICFDDCSWGDRYYVSTVPEAGLHQYVLKLVRRRGYHEIDDHDCAGDQPFLGGTQPDQVARCRWTVYGVGRSLYVSISIGVRPDGQHAVDVSVQGRG